MWVVKLVQLPYIKILCYKPYWKIWDVKEETYKIDNFDHIYEINNK